MWQNWLVKRRFFLHWTHFIAIFCLLLLAIGSFLVQQRQVRNFVPDSEQNLKAEQNDLTQAAQELVHKSAPDKQIQAVFELINLNEQQQKALQQENAAPYLKAMNKKIEHAQAYAATYQTWLLRSNQDQASTTIHFNQTIKKHGFSYELLSASVYGKNGIFTQTQVLTQGLVFFFLQLLFNLVNLHFFRSKQTEIILLNMRDRAAYLHQLQLNFIGQLFSGLFIFFATVWLCTTLFGQKLFTGNLANSWQYPLADLTGTIGELLLWQIIVFCLLSLFLMTYFNFLMLRWHHDLVVLFAYSLVVLLGVLSNHITGVWQNDANPFYWLTHLPNDWPAVVLAILVMLVLAGWMAMVSRKILNNQQKKRLG